MQQDPRVRPLCMLVKHWTRLHELNRPFDHTLSSYAWTLLVIHNLQTCDPPVLPWICPKSLEVAAPLGAANSQSVEGLLLGFFGRSRDLMAMQSVSIRLATVHASPQPCAVQLETKRFGIEDRMSQVPPQFDHSNPSDGSSNVLSNTPSNTPSSTPSSSVQVEPNCFSIEDPISPEEDLGRSLTGSTRCLLRRKLTEAYDCFLSLSTSGSCSSEEAAVRVWSTLGVELRRDRDALKPRKPLVAGWGKTARRWVWSVKMKCFVQN